MVAIGTVADVAKLVGENRAIVALGLADLPRAVNVGLRALIEIAGCGADGTMSAYDLGFRIGPRINAAGRMDAASAVVDLFNAKDKEEARRLAEHLDTRNRERMEAQREIFNRAVEEFETGAEREAQTHAAIIAGDGWHRGVIGLAASKIAERLNRPCVVISFDGDVGHGSARSIEAYHLFNGLTACRELLDKFGGHSHAAGLSIQRGRLAEFRRRLNEHAASCLTEEDLTPSIGIDAEVKAEELSFQLSRDLSLLEPFGAGNPRPVFATRGWRVLSEPQIIKEQHLKLRVAGENNRPFEAIWWRGIEEAAATPQANQRIDLAYELEAHAWMGDIRLQLNVRDMKTSE
jgi:single-stranded-DNA-specific exonuclease